MTAGNANEAITASAARTVTLTAQASESGTEIFVIGSQFQRVENGEGVGHLEIALVPGVYKIKFRAGDAIRETIKPVFADTRVNCPPLAFASPAPLSGSSETTLHVEHEAAAQAASRHVHVKLKGKHAPTPKKSAQIFLFVRDLAPNEADGPCSGMALCDLETGDVIAALPGMGEFGAPDFPYRWKGVTIALKPGGYRLRVTTAALGRMEQVVVASHNWQTQLFLLRREFGVGPNGERSERTEARADLCGGALFMSPLGSGWQSDASATRLTELARQALDMRRARVVSSDDLQTMLDGSQQNPMLGVYACHLLLLAPNPNLQLLQTLTDALRSEAVLGAHPDVEALRLKLPGGVQAAKPFSVPPMLRRGSDLLTEATVARPGLVPAQSLAARAAPYVWGDGVWLVARNVPDLPTPVAAASHESVGVTKAKTPIKSLPRQGWHPGHDGSGFIRRQEAMNQGRHDFTSILDDFDGADEPAFTPHESVRAPRENADFSAARALIAKRLAEQKKAKPAVGASTARAAPVPTFEAVLSQAAQTATVAVTRAQKKIARSEKAAGGDDEYTEDKAEQAAWQAQKAVRELSRAYALPPLQANLLGMLYGKESDVSPAELIGALHVPHATLQTAAVALSQTLSKPPPRKKKS